MKKNKMSERGLWGLKILLEKALAEIGLPREIVHFFKASYRMG